LSFIGINIAAETVQRVISNEMRILVIQRPTMDCIDGMRLDRFMPGHQYEVPPSLAALFLTERWAEPLTGAPPALPIARSDADAGPPSLDVPAALAVDRRGRSGANTRST
jgi:hypothetical protein